MPTNNIFIEIGSYFTDTELPAPQIQLCCWQCAPYKCLYYYYY